MSTAPTRRPKRKSTAPAAHAAAPVVRAYPRPKDSDEPEPDSLAEPLAAAYAPTSAPRRAAPDAPEREARLGSALIEEVAGAGPDVDVLCETYGLRREELSRLTGFSLRALADWSAGKLPSQPALRRLHEIRRLLDALAGIVKPTAIPGWMRQPNPAFDKLSPLQVIELGEIDRLWAMVHQRG